jgi:carboxypeptidase Q
MTMSWLRSAWCVAAVGVALQASAADSVDYAALRRIKAEAFQNSKVMDHLFWMTDANGPRLTNSPGFQKAGGWAVKRLQDMGLANARQEPWGPFGRGWNYSHYEGHLLEPAYASLVGFPLAWTRGTNGPVTGEPVYALLETDADLDKWRGKLAGRIVLVDPPKAQPLLSAPLSHRWTEAELQEEAMAQDPGVPPCREFRLGANGGPCPVLSAADTAKRRVFRKKMQKFLADEGAAVILQTGTGASTGGTVFGMSFGTADPNEWETPCTIALTPEDYNRMVRLLDRGVPVKATFEVKAEFLPPVESFNVTAEIPGGRLKDEVVMVGAHLDSWATGTGATDDGAGSAIAIEALRILKESGLRLDRTVRIGLWAAEEQNLGGSRAYVKQRLGDPQTMAVSKEHDRFSAYFNLDQGGGRIRGVYLQGNDAARPVLESWVAPLRDLGVSIVTIRDQSADNKSFDEVGLPSFQFLQDDLEYGTRTWHTNADVYDRVQPGDMMQSAAVVASFLYHAANREERLPRKPLPKPAAAGPGGLVRAPSPSPTPVR